MTAPNGIRNLGALSVVVSMALLEACQSARPLAGRFPLDNIDQPDLLWPAPPDPPRVQWLGQIDSADALDPPGWTDTLWRWIAGAEEMRLARPMAVAINGQGRLALADAVAGAVHRYDAETDEYCRLGDRESEESTLLWPVGAAVGEDGRVFVADAGAGRIKVFGACDEIPETWGAGWLQRPAGLALGPDGQRLYVVDAPAHQVIAVDPTDGSEIARFGGRGSQPGLFNFPTYVAVDPDGTLWVTDSLNFRIQRLSPNGEPLGAIGRAGDGAGDFAMPKGVGVDSAGRLYAVDAAFENVQIFDREGRLLMAFGGPGAQAGQFTLPAGLFVNPKDGAVWVADAHNRRVQVFGLLEQ